METCCQDECGGREREEVMMTLKAEKHADDGLTAMMACNDDTGTGFLKEEHRKWYEEEMKIMFDGVGKDVKGV